MYIPEAHRQLQGSAASCGGETVSSKERLYNVPSYRNVSERPNTIGHTNGMMEQEKQRRRRQGQRIKAPGFSATAQQSGRISSGDSVVFVDVRLRFTPDTSFLPPIFAGRDRMRSPQQPRSAWKRVKLDGHAQMAD